MSISQRLLAGGVSRAIAQMTLYPIDALRTLAQTRDGRTLADVGASALIRGCTTTSSFALFMGSIQFAVFGVCRSYNIPTSASSALGAAASCVVSVPQDVIKQRLITGVYTHFGEAVTTIFKTEGISGFYSAWRPTMARNVPFVMTTFTTMEFLKRERLSKKEGSAELTLLENVAIGMSSAFVAGLLTQPFDVIKTRMMTQAASTAAPYKSALDCLRTILETEGPLTLYSGLKQRSMYMCLLWGMTFALNGQFESLMLRRRS
jgi:solute carrier family 25 S-adenosylmethionine transporter 26